MSERPTTLRHDRDGNSVAGPAFPVRRFGGMDPQPAASNYMDRFLTQHKIRQSKFEKDREVAKANALSPEEKLQLRCERCHHTVGDIDEILQECPPPSAIFDAANKKFFKRDAKMPGVDKSTYFARDVDTVFPDGSTNYTAGGAIERRQVRHIWVPTEESKAAQDPTLRKCRDCGVLMVDLMRFVSNCTLTDETKAALKASA